MLNSARPQSSWIEETELLYWRAVLAATRELKRWRSTTRQARAYTAEVGRELGRYAWVPAVAWVAGVCIGLALF